MITESLLLYLGICESVLKRFNEAFPDGCIVNEDNLRIANDHYLPITWLVKRLHDLRFINDETYSIYVTAKETCYAATNDIFLSDYSLELKRKTARDALYKVNLLAYNVLKTTNFDSIKVGVQHV